MNWWHLRSDQWLDQGIRRWILSNIAWSRRGNIIDGWCGNYRVNDWCVGGFAWGITDEGAELIRVAGVGYESSGCSTRCCNAAIADGGRQHAGVCARADQDGWCVGVVVGDTDITTHGANAGVQG